MSGTHATGRHATAHGTRLGSNWRRLLNRPHGHGDAPVRLNNLFPDGRQNDLSIWSDQVIVTFLDMWAQNVDLEECLLDEFFHTLRVRLVQRLLTRDGLW